MVLFIDINYIKHTFFYIYFIIIIKYFIPWFKTIERIRKKLLSKITLIKKVTKSLKESKQYRFCLIDEIPYQIKNTERLMNGF